MILRGRVGDEKKGSFLREQRVQSFDRSMGAESMAEEKKEKGRGFLMEGRVEFIEQTGEPIGNN